MSYEESAEPNRCVSGNRATPAADLRDPCHGNTDALRKLVLGHAEGFQELFDQHLARMHIL